MSEDSVMSSVSRRRVPTAAQRGEKPGAVPATAHCAADDQAGSHQRRWQSLNPIPALALLHCEQRQHQQQRRTERHKAERQASHQGDCTSIHSKRVAVST